MKKTFCQSKTFLVSSNAIEQLLADGTGSASIKIKRTEIEKNRTLQGMVDGSRKTIVGARGVE